MDCKGIQEMLPDLAAGIEAKTPEVEKHIASCKACSAKLNEFEQTMALLDEWQAPEPSPYFDTRLQARLREEMARPPAPWFSKAWYSRLSHSVSLRPAWTMSFAAVIFMGALAAGNRSYLMQTASIATNPPSLSVPVQPGTAVADLQALERNDDLYADFDVLDQLQVQDDTNANP
jgi:anti-sigma factor RsiW